ncbi:MAG: DNRLRE domain-containing protein [Kofleriaceae bacterium]
MSRTSRRTLAIYLAGVLVAACGDDPDPAQPAQIHVCGRGDRAELASAVGSGTLELEFLDASGTAIAKTMVLASATDSELPIDIPPAAMSVRVSGRATAGGPVLATGTGATAGDGAGCVCFSLVGEHRAACEGVTCTFADDACRFDPSGPRTLVFGENNSGAMVDDVRDVTADTYIRGATGEQTWNYGGFPEFRADSDPLMVGLLRFDLSAIPTTATITSATLTLDLSTNVEATTNYPIRFTRALESWDEGTNAAPETDGCANWTCRQTGVPWTSPGCGTGSCASTDEAVLPNATVLGMEYSVSLTSAVSGWVAAPTNNFGLAFTIDAPAMEPQTSVWFVSSEAPIGDGSRPRLSVTFELAD